jgi:hypothetical protein
MPSILREVIEHKLMVNPNICLVRHKARWQALKRQDFIKSEVKRMLQVGFIYELVHPQWLTNAVVVLKNNGKLRMCIDYTDLNKACPKGPFPLPCINSIIDSTIGCELLCMLDAYSEYHHISTAKEDHEKTAFMTLAGSFCYISMPFGLKNAGPTFQRAMHITLDPHLGCNIMVYIDKIIIKSQKQKSLLGDLEEAFDSL